jgi:DNA-binding helix-hairpin-helix protein with protein kinase domain
MSLLIGSQVTAESLGWQLTIQKKLGEGGQGVAYLANGPGGDLVVKWYNAEQATDAQRQAIRQLVKDGPPTGLAGKRFVWPLDVVTAPQSRQFGYLMSVIDTQRFAELGDVWSRRKPAPGLAELCEISFQMETDLHSLAVLLFQLWVWHHPLHGELEYRCRCWDLPAKRKVYGETPVLVFDPQDRRNPLPNDPDYTTAARRWQHCPPSLQALFTKAFTTGLKEPASRVTEGEWQTLFRQLKDGVLNCGGCQAVNLWDSTRPSLECWHCHQPIALPPKLVLQRHGRTHTLLLSRTAKLRQRHVDPFATDGKAKGAGQRWPAKGARNR